MRPGPRRAAATRAAAARRPLWTCPACGEQFVSPRLWHSCGRHTYDALFARRVPFAFVSGYGREQLPPQHQRVPLVGKPFTAEDLLGVVARFWARP